MNWGIQKLSHNEFYAICTYNGHKVYLGYCQGGSSSSVFEKNATKFSSPWEANNAIARHLKEQTDNNSWRICVNDHSYDPPKYYIHKSSTGEYLTVHGPNTRSPICGGYFSERIEAQQLIDKYNHPMSVKKKTKHRMTLRQAYEQRHTQEGRAVLLGAYRSIVGNDGLRHPADSVVHYWAAALINKTISRKYKRV